MNTQRYRTEFKNLLERTSLPEGISIEERNERLLPLSMHLVKYVPPKLFRYRECFHITNLFRRLLHVIRDFILGPAKFVTRK